MQRRHTRRTHHLPSRRHHPTRTRPRTRRQLGLLRARPGGAPLMLTRPGARARARRLPRLPVRRRRRRPRGLIRGVGIFILARLSPRAASRRGRRRRRHRPPPTTARSSPASRARARDE